MADRYWVGGTATWDASTTANWSTTDGGSSGASVPGSSDNANFTALSGAVTATLGYSPSVATINFTGFAGTFTDNSISRTISCTTWTSVSGMTLNISSSTLNVTGNNTFTTGGKTYGNVTLTSTANLIVSGASATYNNLTFSTSGSYPTITVPSITVSTNLTVTGTNNTTQRVAWGSLSYFTKSTITVNGSVSLTNVDLFGVANSGSASWAGTSLGNGGNNSSSITFTTPKTVFWVQGASASQDFISNANFATSSGGSVSSANFPLPQDTCIFDPNSFASSGKTVACAQTGVRFPNVDFSLATNSPTFTSTSPSFCGSITLIAGMTFSYTGTASIRGITSSQSSALTTAGKSFTSFNFTYMSSSTLSLQDDMTCAGTFTFQIGTFNANNHNVTVGIFSSTTGSVRTLQMGSGTWTITSSGACWNTTGSVNLTITPGTSTIKFTDSSSSSKTFTGSGKTYANFWNNTGSTGVFIMGDSNAFSNFKVDAGRTQQFTAGTVTTMSTFTAVGTSGAGNGITITSTTSATHTLVCNAANLSTRFFSCDYLTLSYSVCSPTRNFYAGANSTDGGNNTGWTFTVPPTENISNINGVTLANISVINGITAPNVYSANIII